MSWSSRSDRYRVRALVPVLLGALAVGLAGCGGSHKESASLAPDAAQTSAASPSGEPTYAATPQAEPSSGGAGGSYSGGGSGGSGGGGDSYSGGGGGGGGGTPTGPLPGTHYSGNFYDADFSESPGESDYMQVIARSDAGIPTGVTTAVTVTTDNTAEFSIQKDGCTGTSLPSDSKCEFFVRYEAQPAGSHRATLHIGLSVLCTSTSPPACNESGASAARPVRLVGTITRTLDGTEAQVTGPPVTSSQSPTDSSGATDPTDQPTPAAG